MNPKGTCPLAGEDSSCVAEHRKAGTHFLQADPRVLRAKRPSMDGQCGSLRRTMPTCNRPGQMKTIKTVKAMKTGHSDCLPTVSPSSPPSITRSASILPGLSIKLQVYSDSGQYTHSFSIFPLSSRRLRWLHPHFFAFFPPWETADAPPPSWRPWQRSAI